MSAASSASPIASVVIPAHDEEATIIPTLRMLLADAAPGELEVVVVCNGCSDATAERAREVAGVRVEEISAPSKTAGLQRGDEVARAFPRIYLDADVGLSTAAARALVGQLADPGTLLAGVRAELDLAGATRPARWYHDFRLRLPVYRHGVIGAGVYALSAAGSARLGTWPELIADDQLVLRSFADHERAFVPGHRSHVRPAASLRAIVRRGVRVRRGNWELDQGAGPHAPLSRPPAGVAGAVRQTLPLPRAWPSMLLWLAVNTWIRLRVRLAPHSGGDWARAQSPEAVRQTGPRPKTSRGAGRDPAAVRESEPAPRE